MKPLELFPPPPSPWILERAAVLDNPNATDVERLTAVLQLAARRHPRAGGDPHMMGSAGAWYAETAAGILAHHGLRLLNHEATQ